MVRMAFLSGAAFVAAVMGFIAVVAVMQLTAFRRTGFAVYFAPPILLMMAVSMYLSGRDLSIPPELLEDFIPNRPAAVVWITRLVSLFLLLASVERIASYFIARNQRGTLDAAPAAPLGLIISFLVLWAGTVLSPALMGALPIFSHEYTYTLIIGVALLVTSAAEAPIAVKAVRDATIVFMLAGIVAAVVMPTVALETTYQQGFIPGMPRLAGLSSHAVSMGMIALVGLLCVWVSPYVSSLGTLLAWTLGLGVLLVCQSKSAWLAFLLCAAVMILVRNGAATIAWASRPRNTVGLLLVLVAFAGIIAVTGGVVVLGDLAGRLDIFLQTDEGAQLATMTGRDRIWEVALQEWARHPVFGYGPMMFDDTYRVAIGMNFATHGHNQVIDTLARSGTVGAVALVVYWLVLGIYAFRHALSSRGLTAALFLLISLRAISEVPFSMATYGPEILPHFLLLACIGGLERAAATRTPAPAAGPREPVFDVVRA